jgi:hypothetical protein
MPPRLPEGPTRALLVSAQGKGARIARLRSLSVAFPTVARMLISARQAAAELAVVGVPRRHARRLIACGAAGPVTRTAGALLVDQCRVQSLVAREHLTQDEVEEVCPWGLFVARRETPLTDDPLDQLSLLGRDWPISVWTSVWVQVRAEQHGYVPLVATIAGYVVAGGDIVGVNSLGTRAEPLYELCMALPGSWYERFRDKRLDTPPGRPWVVVGWDPSGKVA